MCIPHRVAQSQCLGGLVAYFSAVDNKSNALPIPYAVGLIACAFLSSSLTNPYLMYTFQKGLQIRVALSAMIYKKVRTFSLKIFFHPMFRKLFFEITFCVVIWKVCDFLTGHQNAAILIDQQLQRKSDQFVVIRHIPIWYGRLSSAPSLEGPTWSFGLRLFPVQRDRIFRFCWHCVHSLLRSRSK